MQSTKRIYSAQDLCRKSSLVQRNTFAVLTNFIRKVRKAFAVLNSSSSQEHFRGQQDNFSVLA